MISNTSSSYISSSVTQLQQASERVASGQRINHAADDAAGLVISERLNTDVAGFNQSIRNANDGISFLQTQGGVLGGVSDGLARLQELAIQSSNGILNQSDRSALNKEAQSLMQEISSSIGSAQFNNQSLFGEGSSRSLQVGASADQTFDLSSSDIGQQLQDLGLQSLDFTSASGANAALESLQQMQSAVDGANAQIGASENALNSRINQLYDASISAQESRSRISDADMAKEISNMANEQVKNDVGIAMQALANKNQASVLRYLESL